MNKLLVAFFVVLTSSCGKGLVIDSVGDVPSTSIRIDQSPFPNIQKSLNNKAERPQSESYCTNNQACLPPSLAIIADNAGEFGLVAYVGETVRWKFIGFDHNSDKRKLNIFVANLPPDAVFEPLEHSSATVEIVWTPKQEMRSEKPLEVQVRDSDRCAVKNPITNPCSDPIDIEKYTATSRYDWVVKSKDTIATSQNEENKTENPTTEPAQLPPPVSGYVVQYDGNGHSGGSPPVDETAYKPGSLVTVLGNANQMVKAEIVQSNVGYMTFVGWNSMQNGTGTAYKPGETLTMTGPGMILYAQWVSCSFHRYTGGSVGNRCGGRDRFIQESRGQAQQRGCTSFCWSISCPLGRPENACENL